jgi:hypothetical protein
MVGHVDPCGDGAEGVEGPDHRRVVVGRRGDEVLREPGPDRLGEASDDAEVEEDERAGRQDGDVAGVQVAVEEAVDERALHDGLHAEAQQPRRVEPRGPHGLDVAEVDAVDALHGEHPLADQVVVHDRHDRVGDVLALEDRAHPLHVVRLEAEVHLLVQRPREVLRQRSGEPTAVWGMRSSSSHSRSSARRSDLTCSTSPGRCTLTTPGCRRAAWPVHLADRRGGHGDVVEGGEGGAERAAEVLLDDAPGLVAGKGGTRSRSDANSAIQSFGNRPGWRRSPGRPSRTWDPAR